MGTENTAIVEEYLLQAFLKLKSDAFYDKTRAILRQKLVEFEGNRFEEDDQNAFHQKIAELAQALAGGEESWTRTQDEILGTIDYLAFPKSLITEDPPKGKGKSIFISNRNPLDPTVEQVQYFLDMCVEGFILGMLWVLLIGIDFDRMFSDCSYGNRVRKTVRVQKGPATDWRPYVFEPYFSQYESWRDGALDIAQRILSEEHKDVAILTIDIKSFYYNVNLQEADWSKIWKCTNEASNVVNLPIVRKRLHDFVKGVVLRYSDKLVPLIADCDQSDAQERQTVLPIGFHPSAILANWCMNKFDKAVSDRLNPAFYGRYVDDMLFVVKVERNSSFAKAYRAGDLTGDRLLEDLLLNQSHLVQKDNSATHVPSSAYHVSTDYIEAKASKLIIQSGKVKAFFFDHQAPDAIIDEFRATIARNSSAFKLMPTVDERDLRGSFSIIYELKNDGSPNKLRDIDGMAIDPFELSKFLGKLQKIVPIVNDGLHKRLGSQIVQLLDDKDLIRHYTVWEKVLVILLGIDEQNDGDSSFVSFYRRVTEVIDRVTYRPPQDKQSALDGQNKDVNSIALGLKSALHQYLLSVTSRTLSLSCSKRGSSILSDILEITKQAIIDKNSSAACPQSKDVLHRYLNLYRSTFMTDKYSLALPPYLTIPLLQRPQGLQLGWNGSLMSLCDTYELFVMNAVGEQEELPAAYAGTNSGLDPIGILHYVIPLYPYVVRQDAITSSIYHRHIGRGESIPCPADINKMALKLWSTLSRCGLEGNKNVSVAKLEPGVVTNRANAYFIDVEGTPAIESKRLRVAVGNTVIRDEDYLSALEGKPNRSLRRYTNLCDLLNAAAHANAELLILPELLVPVEWMPLISSFCMREQIAVICGLECVVTHEIETDAPKAYNLTAVLLPYMSNEYPNVSVTYHAKVHWAPVEHESCAHYKIEPMPGEYYELYRWRDVFFPVYCCFELASITERSAFSAYADMVVAVEWNKDTAYYSNIMESLSRDLECYCIQANNAKYGDSRIVQPTKSQIKDVVRVKGGINHTVIVGEIDVELIRKVQMGKATGTFKPLPPGFMISIAKKKYLGTLAQELLDDGSENKHA